MNPRETFTAAVAAHRTGRLAEAEGLYRQVLALEPGNGDALQMLGILANQSGRPAEAVALLRRAVAANPKASGYHNNLGLVLTGAGLLDEGIGAFAHALALQPNFPEALNNLGTALRGKGLLAEAVGRYRQAISLRPGYPEALNNLGGALRESGLGAEAIEVYRSAVSLRPGYVEAIENLGHALRADGQLDEAIAAYRQVLALRPNSPETLSTLGNALKDVGLLDEAIGSYRQSLAMRPEARTGSNLLYTLYFWTDDRETIWREHVRWNETHARPLEPPAVNFPNERSPEKRLKVGYLSPDFRAHSQTFFVEPVLANHDRSRFEVYCFSNVERPDATTQRLRGYDVAWRDVSRLTDEQAAAAVRAEGIDVLVDLTLHMDRSRLLAFARRPAPVQVTWLGYPETTGLTAMDYRLSDPHIDPSADDERYYFERTVRLPETFWCYDPLTRNVNVSDSPAAKNGFVTFGCLNNFCKVTPRTLALWARVMRAVEGSRLLLLAPQGSARTRVLDALGRGGVVPGRVAFAPVLPRERYLELYHQIDMCLDTVPCPGHTTTMDALWMGVPVVHLPGRTAISRGGASILANVGLPEWVARDEADFVRIASALAHDVARLAELRATLCGRMEASVLMDAPRFTRNLEQAFRAMWRAWCAGG